MVSDLARRAAWLEHHRRRLALAAGVLTSVLVWLQLSSWTGSTCDDLDVPFLALVAGSLIRMLVGFVLMVTTAWWEVQVGRAARAGNLPRAIVNR